MAPSVSYPYPRFIDHAKPHLNGHPSTWPEEGRSLLLSPVNSIRNTTENITFRRTWSVTKIEKIEHFELYLDMLLSVVCIAVDPVGIAADHNFTNCPS